MCKQFRSVAVFAIATVASSSITVGQLASQAMAEPLILKVYPTNDRPLAAVCPETVTINSQSRPYREGGYTIDGNAKLSWLAGKFQIAATDEFSVTWSAKLNRKYASCKATAGISKAYGEDFTGHSYLRMRFVGGQVFLILDTTAMYDANDQTTVILNQEVRNGNPYWSWGGTD
jgi:hypothetical protein